MSFFSKLGKELDSMFDSDKKDKKDKEGKEEKPSKADEAHEESTRC